MCLDIKNIQTHFSCQEQRVFIVAQKCHHIVAADCVVVFNIAEIPLSKNAFLLVKNLQTMLKCSDPYLIVVQ